MLEVFLSQIIHSSICFTQHSQISKANAFGNYKLQTVEVFCCTIPSMFCFVELNLTILDVCMQQSFWLW